MNGQRKDIVFLVADLDMEYTIRGLMARPEALGTRSNITFDVFRHPQRDPGVFRHADAWLRTRYRNYQYALVMFDREGCGREDVDAPGLEAAIEERLYRTGWGKPLHCGRFRSRTGNVGICEFSSGHQHHRKRRRASVQ